MIDFSYFLEVWGAAMWRASWQGGLIALIVWSVCRLAPSIPARFQAWLWRLVVLKFLVALVWSAPLEVPLLPTVPQSASSPTMWEPSFPPVSSSITTESSSIVERPAPQALSPWLTPFLVWIAFVGWQAARIVAACRNARRLRSGCRPSENKHLIEELARLSKSAGIRSPPRLLETDGQGSPLLLGIFRPAIVLPATTLSRLDAAERALVLGHELAHVRRADLFWSVIAAVGGSLFCFHPFAWLAERRLRLTQEIAADEFAIALQKHDPVSYATVLVSVVGKLGPARLLPAMSVGMAGSQQSLQQRFAAMRFMKARSRRAVVAYVIVLGLVALPAVVPWTVVAADPPAADKPRNADKPRPADVPRTADKPRTPDQAEPKEGAIFYGKFMSFQSGVLKVNVKDGPTDVWQETAWKVAENTRVVSHIRGTAKEGVAGEAFKQWEAGALISVRVTQGKVAFVEIGDKQAARKAPDRAPDRAADKPAAKVGRQRRIEWGKLVSFQDGALTLKANSGALVEHKIPENAKASVWDDSADVYQPKNAAEAFQQAKEGTWVYVTDDAKAIYVGTRKGQVVGTFVSFKDDRLLILGKTLPALSVKKYGNNLHFNKFADNIPVYESIDGGEYQRVGTPGAVLSKVKEGTIITVHAEGDDNITLIQIGAPKAP